MKTGGPLVLILAGGSGTRLWPLSRQELPKQLLPLFGGVSLIELTWQRALMLTSPSRVFIGTNQALSGKIRRKIPVKKSHIYAEPVARNTAPVIAWFMADQLRKGTPSDTPVIVLSADHFIAPSDAWAATIRRSLPFSRDYLLSLGVKPSRPETGYGYIHCGENIGEGVFRNLSFREKPDAQHAAQYVSDPSYLWNSGMFVFSAGLFDSELKMHAPDIHTIAAECARAGARNVFPKMPDISIDYALMEKSGRLAVATGDFNWDDVGSYEAISRITDPSIAGNFNPWNTKILPVRSSGNIIYSGKPVALLGVDDLVIVDTDSVLMIARRSEIQSIRELRESASADLQ